MLTLNHGLISNELLQLMEVQLTHLRIGHWLHEDLFSWQWWLLVFALILPWFLWWLYVDKRRILQIITLGMYVALIASYLDAMLTELGMWCYRYWVIPLWPRLISADFSVLPISYMVIYQQYREWTGYTVAMAGLSLLFAFPGEAFLIWAGIYELDGWRHIYGVPIFLAMGVFVKWLVDWLAEKNRTSRFQSH